MRILVVLIRGGMGDVLVNTPVLDALRQKWPQARIEMMVRPGAVAMVERHPALDEVLAVDDLDSRNGFRRWLGVVRERRYDMGIVLWSRFSEAWLLYRGGVPVRVGQDSRLTYSWTYTRRVHIRSEHGDTDTHQADSQLDYARAVGADVAHPMPRLYLDDDARTSAMTILSSHDLHSYVVLHVGRGTPLDRQRLPLTPFARIGDALAREWQLPVALTGGAAETDVVAGVADEMRERAVSLAGQLTVPQLGAVLERARLVVANDSGPMHMAAGVGVPTVGIFAMEKDLPKRWGPRGAGNQIVRPAAFPCRPECRKETCPRMACYEYVTADMVLEAVRRAVSSSK